jgi:Skp family chaperone for outer membrane proteins
MKTIRMTIAVVAFAMFAVGTTSAQNKMVSSGSPASPVVMPVAAPANVAVIDTSAFSDEKTGITRVVSAMKAVNTKYTGINTELQGLQNRLETIKQNLQKNQATQAANVTAQQVEEGERLEVQIKRKSEDAQSGYQRELQAALDPLQTDIQTTLTAYAKTKGFNLVIDISRVPVLFVDTTLDITKDFIAEYNKTHP